MERFRNRQRGSEYPYRHGKTELAFLAINPTLTPTLTLTRFLN